MGSIGHDIVAAIWPNGHFHPDFIRAVASGLIFLGVLFSIVVWLTRSIRDFAQFGAARYAFAKTLLERHEALYILVADTKTRRPRPLPGMLARLHALHEEMPRALEQLGKNERALTLAQRHALDEYIDRLKAFERELPADTGHWQLPRQRAYNASCEALAVAVGKLVSGQIRRALKEVALDMRFWGQQETANPMAKRDAQRLRTLLKPYGEALGARWDILMTGAETSMPEQELTGHDN